MKGPNKQLNLKKTLAISRLDNGLYIFQVYMNALNILVNFVGPFTALAVFNTKIYKGLQKNSNEVNIKWSNILNVYF